MKTRITLIALTLLFINTTSIFAFDRVKTGKQITKVLRTIENWDMTTFEKYMATPDDILEIILKSDNEPLKAMASKKIEESKEQWFTKLNKEFKRVYTNGKELEIDWKKIKYQNFTYDLDNVGIDDVYKGKLFFSYKDKTYKLSIGFLTNNKGVRIGELEHLREYTE